jgi:2,4-diketo-3-deoxy-L-fuconate hydrolase
LDPLYECWDAVVDEIENWTARLSAGEIAAEPLALRRNDVLAPVSSPQIFQAAANYRKHVIDLMVASPRPEHSDTNENTRREIATELMDNRAASGIPTVFAGMPSSLSGPFDNVQIPRITEQCDWELELAAVIGRRARFIDRSEAFRFIAGYTIVNDISMRDRLYPTGDSSRGADWLACKGAPTFLPTGPLIVPARYVTDPQDLTITLELNGETMQNESSSDMIFNLDRLLEHTSACAELRPGDLLLTGSPAGNGVHHGRFLREGDVMTGSITGLGTQLTPVIKEIQT